MENEKEGLGVLSRGSPTAPDLVRLTATVVSAYIQRNPLSSTDLPRLIRDVHLALTALRDGPVGQTKQKPTPDVSISESITPDYLICLDDGQRYRSLKRHLRTLGMTPDDYREKWGLPSDYPMVAPNYSAVRSKVAKEMGLGRKRIDPLR